MRNCQNVFQSWLHHFIFPPTKYEVSNSPHPHNHLLLSIFFIKAILVDIWYLIMVLICIFLVTNDVGHLCICIFAIQLSLVKYLFKTIAHLNWVGYLIELSVVGFFFLSQYNYFIRYDFCTCSVISFFIFLMAKNRTF